MKFWLKNACKRFHDACERVQFKSNVGPQWKWLTSFCELKYCCKNVKGDSILTYKI